MKIEMHAHTAEVSPCARVNAKDVVTACKAYGYDAVVITDHFNNYILDSFSGNNKQKVKRYLQGYEIAKEAGDKVGLTVLFGVEVCIPGGREDFLLYGITPDFLYHFPKLYLLSQEQLFNEAHAVNALVYQAHPCRDYCHPLNPFLMDGAEVLNGNYLHGGTAPGNENNNDKALKWAMKYPHLLHVSGSDIHNLEDVGSGGIITPDSVTLNTTQDLADILKSKQFNLIVPENLWREYNGEL